MVSSKLEYIWLDGYKPIQSLRSKTKIEKNFSGKLEDCPTWCFDGSSTEQAPGGSSDCLLKPVFIAKDPQRKNAYLVMCEVLSPDSTAHESNGRATIEDDDNDFWFGFEQEYFLWNPATNKPIGFPEGGFPGPQGPYYCSVGATNAYGRAMVEEHLDACLEAGLNVEGINAEVATGQWQGETIMATTTTSKKINDITEGFGEAADRYRVINERLVETGKKTANAALDGYEKTVASYVDFRQQLAEASQLDWVSTVVKAQNDFLTEVNAAYVSAARDALK
jgi:hypothetical protein